MPVERMRPSKFASSCTPEVVQALYCRCKPDAYRTVPALRKVRKVLVGNGLLRVGKRELTAFGQSVLDCIRDRRTCSECKDEKRMRLFRVFASGGKWVYTRRCTACLRARERARRRKTLPPPLPPRVKQVLRTEEESNALNEAALLELNRITLEALEGR